MQRISIKLLTLIITISSFITVESTIASGKRKLPRSLSLPIARSIKENKIENLRKTPRAISERSNSACESSGICVALGNQIQRLATIRQDEHSDTDNENAWSDGDDDISHNATSSISSTKHSPAKKIKYSHPNKSYVVSDNATSSISSTKHSPAKKTKYDHPNHNHSKYIVRKTKNIESDNDKDVIEKTRTPQPARNRTVEKKARTSQSDDNPELPNKFHRMKSVLSGENDGSDDEIDASSELKTKIDARWEKKTKTVNVKNDLDQGRIKDFENLFAKVRKKPDPAYANDKGGSNDKKTQTVTINDSDEENKLDQGRIKDFGNLFAKVRKKPDPACANDKAGSNDSESKNIAQDDSSAKSVELKVDDSDENHSANAPGVDSDRAKKIQSQMSPVMLESIRDRAKPKSTIVEDDKSNKAKNLPLNSARSAIKDNDNDNTSLKMMLKKRLSNRDHDQQKNKNRSSEGKSKSKAVIEKDQDDEIMVDLSPKTLKDITLEKTQNTPQNLPKYKAELAKNASDEEVAPANMVADIKVKADKSKKASHIGGNKHNAHEGIDFAETVVENELGDRDLGLMSAEAAGDDPVWSKSVWMRGSFSSSVQNPTSGHTGNRGNVVGGSIGFEIENDEGTLYGISYNHAVGKYKYKSEGDKARIDFNTFSLYTQRNINKLLLRGILSYGIGKIKTEDNLESSDSAVTASFNSHSYAADLMAGYRMKHKDINFMPFAQTHYSHSTEAAHERSNKLKINKISSSQLTGKLGMRVSKAFAYSSNTALIPHLTGSVQYDLIGEKQEVVAFDADGKKLDLSVNKSGGKFERPRFGYNLSTGLRIRHGRVEISTQYNGHFRRNFHSHQGSLRLKIAL